MVGSMKLKAILGATLLFLVIVFTLQNVEVVNIQFLLWNFALSRVLMIFLVLGIGITIGWFLGSLSRPQPK
jgi:uncharacterized integral membrane protein